MLRGWHLSRKSDHGEPEDNSAKAQLFLAKVFLFMAKL